MICFLFNFFGGGINVKVNKVIIFSRQRKNRLYIYVCVCVCVCGHVYVVYEDTNLYNDMGMT